MLHQGVSVACTLFAMGTPIISTPWLLLLFLFFSTVDLGVVSSHTLPQEDDLSTSEDEAYEDYEDEVDPEEDYGEGDGEGEGLVGKPQNKDYYMDEPFPGKEVKEPHPYNRQICSDALLKEIKRICKGVNRFRKRFSSSFRDGGSVTNQFFSNRISHHKQPDQHLEQDLDTLPRKNNVVDECCRRPCSVETIVKNKYCNLGNPLGTQRMTITTPPPQPQKQSSLLPLLVRILWFFSDQRGGGGGVESAPVVGIMEERSQISSPPPLITTPTTTGVIHGMSTFAKTRPPSGLPPTQGPTEFTNAPHIRTINTNFGTYDGLNH